MERVVKSIPNVRSDPKKKRFDRLCSDLVKTCTVALARVLEWCRMIVELPHHEGCLCITPLQASGMAAFYSATANLVTWLQSLPHASEWVAGQNLADPDSWTCSAFHTLKQLHEKLLQHCDCKEWAPPPRADAPAPGAHAPEHDDDNARPLSLPPGSGNPLVAYFPRFASWSAEERSGVPGRRNSWLPRALAGAHPDYSR